MIDHNLQDSHSRHSTRKLLSSLWYRYQIHGHHQGCNHGSGALYYQVLSLAKSKQSILQHHHTFSAISKPTILYSSLIFNEHCRYYLKMLTADTKTSNTNLPTQIAPDVWILTTPLAAPVNTMTLICPEKAMESIIIQKPVHILKLPMACSATSPNFYLPPRYETPTLDVNISLNMANLCIINILSQDFYIWKHLGNNRSDVQLQHLTTIPSIPVHKIYQHLLNNTLPIMPFDMDKESTEHTGSIWTLFLHQGIYITAIGLLIPVGQGLFCCYFFWCLPARLAC